MNKTELITAVAEKTGMSKKDADSAVNAVLDTIIEAVACEEKVQIVGFGTFEVRARSERQGRDPRTKMCIRDRCTAPPTWLCAVLSVPAKPDGGQPGKHGLGKTGQREPLQCLYHG